MKTTIITLTLLLFVNNLHSAQSFEQLQSEVETKLAKLETLVATANAKGIDTSYEEVAVVTAKIFQRIAPVDAKNPDVILDTLKKPYFFRKRADTYAQGFAERELEEVIILLDEAAANLKAVIENPDSRRTSVPLELKNVKLRDGYLHIGDQPVFNYGITWWNSESVLPGLGKEAARAFGRTSQCYLTLGMLDSKMQLHPRHAEKIDSLNGSDKMGTFIGHHLPGWLKKQHPEVVTGATHFVGYDIDNPVVTNALNTLIDKAYSRIGPMKEPQIGHLIANEPHWFSGEKEWAVINPSEYTYAKFRKWLKQRHGAIENLNQLWNSNFKSFDEVSLKIPIAKGLQGTPKYFDWCRFNMYRVTEWFAMLKSGILKYDPEGRVHIKLIPSHFSGASRTHGLDFGALCDLQGILGADAKMLTNSDTTSGMAKKAAAEWSKRYSAYWRGMVIPYDFFKSMYPNKLLLDSEFHAFSTVHWRDMDMGNDYIRMALWLAHMHGMGVNQTWYWGRGKDMLPKKGDSTGFLGTFAHRPIALNAYARSMKELNAYGKEVAALNRINRPARIFYSEATAINDPEYMERIYEVYKALYHKGIFLGFETAQSIWRKTAREITENSILISAGTVNVTPEDCKAMSDYLASGGTVIFTGKDNFTKDEYQRPITFSSPSSSGTIINMPEMESTKLLTTVENQLKNKKLLPDITCEETNSAGAPGCMWRIAELNGKTILFIANLGCSDAEISVKSRSGKELKAVDLITNSETEISFKLKPYDMRLLKLKD